VAALVRSCIQIGLLEIVGEYVKIVDMRKPVILGLKKLKVRGQVASTIASFGDE
jgi:hypothetical protein